MKTPLIPTLKKISMLCIGLAGLNSLLATEPIPAIPPEGTLLKSAPEYSKWTISYVFPKSQGPGSAPVSGDLPSRAVMTKTKNILHEEIFDGRGCCLDTWYVGAQQYRKPHGKNVWYVSEPAKVNNAQDSEYDPLPANGFRGWEWVGRESYVGQIDNEGRPALVFVPGGAASLKGSDLQESLKTQSHVAFVDATTKLPISFRNGTAVQNFRFESQPPVLQQLPAELLAQIKNTEESRARLLQAAPRPY